MVDVRFNEYLMENGYILDLRPGGFLGPDGKSITRSNGRVDRITKSAPFFINGKSVLDFPGFERISFEEFKAWEATQGV